MVSFDRERIELYMLSEYVLEILTVSKDVLVETKICCYSHRVVAIRAVYKKLSRLLGHLMRNENCILKCLRIYGTVFPRHYEPDRSVLPNLYEGHDAQGFPLPRKQKVPDIKDESEMVPMTPLCSLRIATDCCFPSLSSFELSSIEVIEDNLPFLVSDFVRDDQYRMVSKMNWMTLYCCCVSYYRLPFVTVLL